MPKSKEAAKDSWGHVRGRKSHSEGLQLANEGTI